MHTLTIVITLYFHASGVAFEMQPPAILYPSLEECISAALERKGTLASEIDAFLVNQGLDVGSYTVETHFYCDLVEPEGPKV